MLVDEIRNRLATLEPEYLDVQDDSAAHAGHAGAAGGAGHFALILVSPQFRGHGMLARHRMIYALLGDLMPARIHALQIRALTPEEL
ncbi:BolA family protein [Chitinibacteraceae bacterium HSL-7]